MRTILRADREYFTGVLVLLENADDILDVKPLTIVVVESLKVAILKLATVELRATFFVNDVAIGIYQPSVLVDSTALFVDEEALFGL